MLTLWSTISVSFAKPQPYGYYGPLVHFILEHPINASCFLTLREQKRNWIHLLERRCVCVCVSVFCLMIFLVSLFSLANESLIDCRELVTPVSRWTQFPILIPPYLTYGDYTLDIRTGPKQGSLQNPTPPALTLRFCDFHLGGSPWGLSPPELWRKHCRNSETKILNF